MDRKNKLFENTYRKYEKDLQKFIYTLTRKDQFAMEEIFQNTLEKAFRNLKYLRDDNKIKTWIFSIAKTEARRYYAANKVNDKYEIDELNEDITITVDNDDDFTEYVTDSILVSQIINSFSEGEQQIFMLHYYNDISFNEISEILNINYNTIRSIHIRGIAKMKKIYREKGRINENK